MLVEQVVEVECLFLGNVMDCEVSGFTSDESGSFLEKCSLVGLFQEEKIKDECESTHDAGDVLSQQSVTYPAALSDSPAYLSPSPSEITFGDESLKTEN